MSKDDEKGSEAIMLVEISTWEGGAGKRITVKVHKDYTDVAMKIADKVLEKITIKTKGKE